MGCSNSKAPDPGGGPKHELLSDVPNPLPPADGAGAGAGAAAAKATAEREAQRARSLSSRRRMSLGEQQAQVDFERSLSEGGGEHVFAITHVAGGAQDGWHLKVVLADSPGTGPTLACGKEVIPCHELSS